jgi:hypothetical protein
MILDPVIVVATELVSSRRERDTKTVLYMTLKPKFQFGIDGCQNGRMIVS